MSNQIQGLKTLTVITDFNRPRAVLELPSGLEIEALRSEYDSILDAGPNPWCHETDKPRQQAWLEKVREREQFLTLKYGGENIGDGEIVFSPITFANWLVREKGAVMHRFCEYCMAEFD